jgi:hypothetical protein
VLLLLLLLLLLPLLCLAAVAIPRLSLIDPRLMNACQVPLG